MGAGIERQLPLDLGHLPGSSRDDLAVSDANRQAVTFIENWPDWPSPVAVLAGPAGSGKSHLASIWQDAARASRLDPANLAAAADATRVLLEDVDRAALDEAGLFHLINAVLQGQGRLLMTARSFPAAWSIALPDLKSRVQAASIVEIREPDDALLAGVMTKLFADRQVEVEPHVVQFAVRRIERSLATAIAVVDRLDRAALERGTRITRSLAAEIVSALDQGQGEFDL